jgi:hypothetical protein
LYSAALPVPFPFPQFSLMEFGTDDLRLSDQVRMFAHILFGKEANI